MMLFQSAFHANCGWVRFHSTQHVVQAMADASENVKIDVVSW